MIHRAVGAESKDVQPVVPPRGDRRRAREDTTETLPIERRWTPGRAVPRFVIHRAVGAEAKDVQPVVPQDVTHGPVGLGIASILARSSWPTGVPQPVTASHPAFAEKPPFVPDVMSRRAAVPMSG